MELAKGQGGKGRDLTIVQVLLTAVQAAKTHLMIVAALVSLTVQFG